MTGRSIVVWHLRNHASDLRSMAQRTDAAAALLQPQDFCERAASVYRKAAALLDNEAARLEDEVAP